MKWNNNDHDRTDPATDRCPGRFPVAWEQPEDERLFWQIERMHWPDPMTPMDFAFMRSAHEGFSWAFAQYGVPLAFSARHINYRWYFSVNPTVTDMTLMPSMMQAGLDNLTATIAQLGTLWHDEWLPEVLEHLDAWEQFDLAGASMPELLAHFDETMERHERVWQIHFLQTFPVYMAMSTFDDLYQDLFGTEDGLVAYKLLQGLDNKTVKLGREFWKLSRQGAGVAGPAGRIREHRHRCCSRRDQRGPHVPDHVRAIPRLLGTTG